MSNGSCSVCVSWSACPLPLRDEQNGNDHFQPGEFKYCMRQIKFLVPYVDDFRTGLNWPPSPPTGYVDDPTLDIQRSLTLRTSAARDIVVDFLARFDATGEDGRDLLFQMQQGNTRFTGRAFSALLYMTGFKSKRQRYSQWRAGRERDQRKAESHIKMRTKVIIMSK